jgi:ABC-type Fe3+/spermidine/putrescine transport system ATPase subunit
MPADVKGIGQPGAITVAELGQVTKTYDGIHALRSVDLRFSASEVTALLGPSC